MEVLLMITIRKENWEKSLNDYVKNVGLTKFKYGQHDCIKFSAGAFKAVTGLDAMAGIESYSNVKQAMAMLEKHKGVFAATHTALTKHPVEEKEVTRAITGDIVGLLNQDGEETVGVVYDMGSIAVVGKQGLHFIPLHPNAVRCWSV